MLGLLRIGRNLSQNRSFSQHSTIYKAGLFYGLSKKVLWRFLEVNLDFRSRCNAIYVSHVWFFYDKVRRSRHWRFFLMCSMFPKYGFLNLLYRTFFIYLGNMEHMHMRNAIIMNPEYFIKLKLTDFQRSTIP